LTFTPEDLETFLSRKAQEEWSKNSQPYFLALVQPELKKMDKDYKEAIPDQRLNEFVDQAKSLKLVRHPTQFAKVGIIPSDKEFSFSDDKRTPEPPIVPMNKRVASEAALVQFVDAISRMPKEDLVEFKVPATLLVSLLNRK